MRRVMRRNRNRIGREALLTDEAALAILNNHMRLNSFNVTNIVIYFTDKYEKVGSLIYTLSDDTKKYVSFRWYGIHTHQGIEMFLIRLYGNLIDVQKSHSRKKFSA